MGAHSGIAVLIVRLTYQAYFSILKGDVSELIH